MAPARPVAGGLELLVTPFFLFWLSLGPLWASFGALWGSVGPFLVSLMLFCGLMGLSLRHLGFSLGVFGRI